MEARGRLGSERRIDAAISRSALKAKTRSQSSEHGVVASPAHRNSAKDGLDLQRIAAAIAALHPEHTDAILVAEIKVPGEVLLLSPALRQALTSQGKLP
jgi:hypothetical protein